MGEGARTCSGAESGLRWRTACGRPGDDGLRRYVVHVLIRRRLAAAANDAARLCEAASGRAWRLTPARHCASCASTSIEVNALRSARITEMPEPAFAVMIPRRRAR